MAKQAQDSLDTKLWQCEYSVVKTGLMLQLKDFFLERLG